MNYLLLILGLGLAAFGRAQSVALLGEALYPESIAVDSRTGDFYVGSNGDGSVQLVRKGEAKVLQPAGADGRTEALGIKVDEKRDRLWVLDGTSVYVYRLSNNQLLKKIAAPPAPKSMINDLALDAQGNAYITDSLAPRLLKVNGDYLTISVFRDLSGVVPYGNQNGFPYNLNGIVLSGDGRSLLSVKTNEGTLWEISLTDDVVSQVTLSENVTKGDGLVWGNDETLYVMRNFENKISAVRIKEGLGQVRSVPAERLKIPTSAVFVSEPEPRLIVVNSQFREKPLVLPFTIVEVPLGR